MMENVFGLSSVHISLVSATISFLSLCVAIRLAWSTKFSPPKLVGTLRYSVVWSFCGQTDEKSDNFLVPYFWLVNVGARPMMVADMRLVLRPSNGDSFTLYPVHSVPSAAIETPNTFSDHELLRIGDAPFGGFALAHSDKWTNQYVFSLSSKEHALLNGRVSLSVEVKQVGAKRFMQVLSQQVNFNKAALNWLEWVGIGGPSASYYYSDKSDRE
jgi:hypothetical protein